MANAPSQFLQARNGVRLEIRPLTAAETAGLQRFNAGLSPATRDLFLPHAYDEGTLGRYVERSAAGLDRSFVLCHGAEVVGYFFLWEFSEPVPLLGVGLADAWQGQGLGEPLMQRLIAEARLGKRAGVELTTVTTNTRAYRLYLRVGFQLVGEVDNVAGDGRVVREFRLFLPLQPGAHPPVREFRPPV
ncbi:MAG: GNAT family N-acetyltransferase [Verrucomicrobia bacterium]|nr:GNAT family N-acetyltransferase [Verrucomicrobiota bacterium]